MSVLALFAALSPRVRPLCFTALAAVVLLWSRCLGAVISNAYGWGMLAIVLIVAQIACLMILKALGLCLDADTQQPAQILDRAFSSA